MPGGYERVALFAFLRAAGMFSRCTDEQLEEVEACSRFESRPAGSELVRQGDPGNEFFVLLSGKADVVRDGRQVDVIGPGEFFGELALFDDAPRNATVVAAEAVSLVVIGRDAFQQLLASSAGVRAGVLQGMAHRLHELDAKV
jgi:CRP-like cAMP-binding protein